MARDGMINRYRLYYADGSVWNDTDGIPQSAPIDLVVAIGQPRYRDVAGDLLINGHAYLYRRDLECWTQVGDAIGEAQHLVRYAHLIDVVRYGHWHYPNTEFREIRDRARLECDLVHEHDGRKERR